MKYPCLVITMLVLSACSSGSSGGSLAVSHASSSAAAQVETNKVNDTSCIAALTRLVSSYNTKTAMDKKTSTADIELLDSFETIDFYPQSASDPFFHTISFDNHNYSIKASINVEELIEILDGVDRNEDGSFGSKLITLRYDGLDIPDTENIEVFVRASGQAIIPKQAIKELHQSDILVFENLITISGEDVAEKNQPETTPPSSVSSTARDNLLTKIEKKQLGNQLHCSKQ